MARFSCLLLLLVLLPCLLSYQFSRLVKTKSNTRTYAQIECKSGKPLRGAVVGVLAGLVAITLGSSNVLAEYSYLAEPTQEFKDEEKRFAAFKEQQLKIRKEWDVLYERLKGSEGKPEVTAPTLNEMTKFLKKIEGIPTGVKKPDIVKVCRGLKYAGEGKKISLLKIKESWTVQCEIEYEALIQEYNKEVLPNNKPGATLF